MAMLPLETVMPSSSQPAAFCGKLIGRFRTILMVIVSLKVQ
jgi:hypothetical protein